ncbi:hypothetical protein BDW59DRAFT_163162 [Aspergillus cavernicola]|uniref:KOW domain-containing protein n=1 Tax=Aspergillus cavernicola TaxID=176166 RepID=A0ABR4I7I3_9EURO
MPHPIYLPVFSNAARPAHHAVFIPTGITGRQGKVIHVIGNTATGFFLEFKRSYDFLGELRKYEIIPLAEVKDQYIADTAGNGDPSTDTTARDRLESVATVIRPQP